MPARRGDVQREIQRARQRFNLAADTYTMRLGVSVPTTDSNGMTALRFASAVERRSNGQLKIEVYPSGQLAKEQEALEGLTTGAVDFST